MSHPQLQAFSEADEQLFQQVRNELLGKMPSEGAAPAAPIPEETVAPAPVKTQSRRLWWMLAILGILAALGSVLGWLFPKTFGDFKTGAIALLTVVGIAMLASRAQQTRATQKPQAFPTLLPPTTSPWRRFLVSFVWFVL